MNVNETIEIIKKLHDGQVDRTGVPYYIHCIAVMENLHLDANDEDRIIALLHDSIEDCFDTVDEGISYLKLCNYSQYILDGVILLTRFDGKYYNGSWIDGSYQDYIKNIIKQKHFGALIVKLSDNLHNSNPERIEKISCSIERQKLKDTVENRYKKARVLLEEELSKWKNRQYEE